MKKELLKQAKANYPKGTLFYSATKNLKRPLEVVELKIAKHEDRMNEIQELKMHILSTYNALYPNKRKDFYKKLNGLLTDDVFKPFLRRLEELEAEGFDIVNEEGGVIYCADTNSWAEIVIE